MTYRVFNSEGEEVAVGKIEPTPGATVELLAGLCGGVAEKAQQGD